MQPTVPNTKIFSLALVPFLSSLTIGLTALFLTGFNPIPILIIACMIILSTTIFTFINKYFDLKSSSKRLQQLYSGIDKHLIPDQVLNLFPKNNDITTATQLINYLGKNITQLTGTDQTLQNTLAGEREKLQWVLHNTHDPVVGLDLHYNISFLNAAAEKTLGLDSTLAMNQPIDQILKFQGRLGDLPLKAVLPLRSNGFEGVIFNQNEVKTICLLNNKEAFANILTTQIKHGAFINISCILTFHDETEEKQLEAMKLDFISMAAHELRTPLTSIKGYMSVFIQENEKKLSEDQMMFIRRINNSTQQLSALIENLLSVSRVERNAMTITTQPMDWVKTLQIAFEQFEHRAYEKRITLTYIKPTTPIPTVQADNVRINEVINNFLANALNYTEPGGKVTLWCEYKDNYVITHVKDTGHGISKESLAHLFTKFYRAPGNADQASKGNGLGLYISKAIVELHKGKIWAESEGLGKGSTFSFSLPVVASNQIDISILTKKL